jgi:hypothetical protein
MPGEQSTIDLLAGYKDQPAAPRSPDFVSIVSPSSLADVAVAPGPDGWTVTAPSDDRLAAARAELGLDADAPVPLRLGVAAGWPDPVVSPNPAGFGASKVVWLGMTAANPDLVNITINDAPPAPDDTGTLVFSAAKDAHTTFHIDADDTMQDVNWLSSAGEMHDFDLHNSYMTFGKDDKTEGQLAVVLRDERGGVTWQLWNIRGE